MEYTNYSTHEELERDMEDARGWAFPYEVGFSDGTAQVWFEESDKALEELMEEWNEMYDIKAVDYDTIL